MSHGLGAMQQLLIETMHGLLAEQRARDLDEDCDIYIERPGAEVGYFERNVVLVHDLYRHAFRRCRKAGDAGDYSTHQASAGRALRRLVAQGILLRVWPSTVYTYEPCPCCGHQGRHPRGAHAFKKTIAVILAEERRY